jgi:hypothetical protein
MGLFLNWKIALTIENFTTKEQELGNRAKAQENTETSPYPQG